MEIHTHQRQPQTNGKSRMHHKGGLEMNEIYARLRRVPTRNLLCRRSQSAWLRGQHVHFLRLIEQANDQADLRRLNCYCAFSPATSLGLIDQ